MGLYGKYTKTVDALAITQMVSGVLMLGLGVALRVLVCSWITDAAFGFWVGPWVFAGGLIGHYSTKRNIYGLIGYFLGFNSLSIMFTSMVIFCHSFAWYHFNDELHANLTNTKTSAAHCYTHQSWDAHVNGRRGMGLGASMIAVCAVEVIMAAVSSGYCWAAAKVEPTDCPRQKAVIQGIQSDVLASKNVTPIQITPTGETNAEISAHHYEDISAATPGARSMNIYDEARDAEERPMNIYVCSADDSNMTPESANEDVQVGDIEMKTMHPSEKTTADDSEVTLGAAEVNALAEDSDMKTAGTTYENVQRTSTGDQDPGPSTDPFSPPLDPCYPSPASCPESETTV